MIHAAHATVNPSSAESTSQDLRLVLGCSTEAEQAALTALLRRESQSLGQRQVAVTGDDKGRDPRVDTRPPVRVVAVLSGHGDDADALAAARLARGAVIAVRPETGVTQDVMRQVALLERLGIQHVALAVLSSGISQGPAIPPENIEAEFRDLAKRIGLAHPQVLRITESAAAGGVTEGPSGATLETFLRAVERDARDADRLPFRFLVESARPSPEGGTVVAGSIASGALGHGERVRIQPMGKESRVAAVHRTADASAAAVAAVEADRSATLTLEDAIEIPAGSVISTIAAPALVADQFEATLFWLHDEPLYQARRYRARIGMQTTDCSVTDIKYEVNVATGEHLAASRLNADAIAVCNISLNRPVAFDPYRENPVTGFLTILDRDSGEPLGIALLHFALRRAENIHIQHVDIHKAARAVQKAQNPCVIWFTGLSGSGKSTIANRVEQLLYGIGNHTYLLDGDNVRHGLNRDLGFTEADRVENIRRVGEVAKLMVDAGLIVLTAFISPFRTERQMARDLLTDGEFLEVFVDVPLEIAEQRDPKGLYKKARRGELRNFTGIDSPYEPPENPDLTIDTASLTPEEAADRVVMALRARGRLLT